MSEPEKSYLTSDISTILNIPRTTLNDWLKTYAEYLESEPRGKRRAYNEKSLEVLRQVASYRDAGLSAIEIDVQLAKIYGIRPEITTEEPKKQVEVSETTLTTMPENNTALAHISEDDIGRLLQMLDAQQAARQHGLRRFGRFAMISIFLLFAIVAVMLAILTVKLVEKMDKDANKNEHLYQHLSVQLQETAAELDSKQAVAISQIVTNSAKDKATQVDEIKKIAVTLDKNSREYQKAIQQLKSELDATRKARDLELKKLLEAKDKAAAAELIKLREEFARKQLEELKRLESSQSKNKELEEKIKEYKKSAPQETQRLKEDFQAQFNKLKAQIESEKKRRKEAEVAAETARKQTIELMSKDIQTTIEDKP